jgi:hypothetical protein
MMSVASATEFCQTCQSMADERKDETRVAGQIFCDDPTRNGLAKTKDELPIHAKKDEHIAPQDVDR